MHIKDFLNTAARLLAWTPAVERTLRPNRRTGKPLTPDRHLIGFRFTYKERIINGARVLVRMYDVLHATKGWRSYRRGSPGHAVAWFQRGGKIDRYRSA